MNDYNVETRIAADRSLTIRGLPFQPGDKVKVTVRPEDTPSENGQRYPLRGKPLRYTDPFAPIAEKDWDTNGMKISDLFVGNDGFTRPKTGFWWASHALSSCHSTGTLCFSSHRSIGVPRALYTTRHANTVTCSKWSSFCVKSPLLLHV